MKRSLRATFVEAKRYRDGVTDPKERAYLTVWIDNQEVAKRDVIKTEIAQKAYIQSWCAIAISVVALFTGVTSLYKG